MHIIRQSVLIQRASGQLVDHVRTNLKLSKRCYSLELPHPTEQKDVVQQTILRIQDILARIHVLIFWENRCSVFVCVSDADEGVLVAVCAAICNEADVVRVIKTEAASPMVEALHIVFPTIAIGGMSTSICIV